MEKFWAVWCKRIYRWDETVWEVEPVAESLGIPFIDNLMSVPEEIYLADKATHNLLKKAFCYLDEGFTGSIDR
jgi:hypothetical protein